MSIRILAGDARDTLATLPERTVQLCMTSPPYWRQRKYLDDDHADKHLEIGWEPTPAKYCDRLMGVFDAVQRVLRDDGVCVVNIGEKMPGAGSQAGIPWQFASAMVERGWIWRDTMIWEKPAPMPAGLNGWRWEKCRVVVGRKPVDWRNVPKGWDCGEGAHDQVPKGNYRKEGTRKATVPVYAPCPGCPKCEPHGGLALRRGSLRSTTAHEYLMIFTKVGHCYYGDREGWATPCKASTLNRNRYTRVLDDPDEQFAVKHDHEYSGSTANMRSVLRVASQNSKAAHYAVYPEALVIPFIKALTSAEGACPTCGACWARVVQLERTLGWKPTCSCPPAPAVPCVVLDPLAGTGTTAIASKMLGRDAIACELNEKYVEIMRRRMDETAPLLMEAT